MNNNTLIQKNTDDTTLKEKLRSQAMFMRERPIKIRSIIESAVEANVRIEVKRNQENKTSYALYTETDGTVFLPFEDATEYEMEAAQLCITNTVRANDKNED